MTAADIDSEVMKMLHDSYKQAKKLLKANREIMDKLADYLIEKETITGKEFMKIYRKEKGIPEPEEEEKDKKEEPEKPKAAEAQNAPVNQNPSANPNAPAGRNTPVNPNVPTGPNMPVSPNGPAGWTVSGNPTGYYQEGARADGTNVGLFSHSSLNPDSMPGQAPVQQAPVQMPTNIQQAPVAGQRTPEVSGTDFSQTLAEKTGYIVQQPPAEQTQQLQHPQEAEAQQQNSMAADGGENEQRQ